jgi:hypothetical protein
VGSNVKILEDGTVVFEDPLDEAHGTLAEDGRVPWEVAACHFFVNTGNIAATARKFSTTVYGIKKLMMTVWWQEEASRIRSESRVKIDAGFTRLVEQGIQMLEDRLTHGEITKIKTDKDGNETIFRSAPRMIDIARVTDMAFMKRQLVRNEPTVVAGDTQALTVLAQKLRALGSKDPALLHAPAHSEGMGLGAQLDDVELNDEQ